MGGSRYCFTAAWRHGDMVYRCLARTYRCAVDDEYDCCRVLDSCSSPCSGMKRAAVICYGGRHAFHVVRVAEHFLCAQAHARQMLILRVPGLWCSLWASTKAKLAGNGCSSNLQQRLRCFQRALSLETGNTDCSRLSRFSFPVCAAHNWQCRAILIAIAGRALSLNPLYRCMEAVR
jgi:hypothetical protein